tara:strand:- start:51 stop:257 length:207 start_codon:yes stop_codon:yes gene_type:complete
MQLSTRELTDTILVLSMENASLKNKVKDLEERLDDARHQVHLCQEHEVNVEEEVQRRLREHYELNHGG